ncbi:hypothetical protein C8J57DRAFT_1236895 [Mycena rebaudengoi]|nr:hypothetical protein C8J57DRAFT_1236895 [Mycena rebaudengoi]
MAFERGFPGPQLADDSDELIYDDWDQTWGPDMILKPQPDAGDAEEDRDTNDGWGDERLLPDGDSDEVPLVINGRYRVFSKTIHLMFWGGAKRRGCICWERGVIVEEEDLFGHATNDAD